MGVSYESTSAIGLFVHTVPGAFLVVGVVPDSQADMFGLLNGDAFIKTDEKSLTLEQVIREGSRQSAPLFVTTKTG